MKRIILMLLIFCSFNSSGQNFFYSHNKIASCTLPTITTASITDIIGTTATSGGNVTSSGGCSVTVRGCQWSADSGFSYLTGSTSDGSGTGGFSSSLNSMNASSTYYVRAYATNSVGTSYGSVIGFTTAAVSAANIDYLILTYEWSTTDGTDLDTKSEMLNSSYSDLDNIGIGWVSPLSVAISTSARDSVLMWGGDNTLSGQETVLLNVKKYKTLTGTPNETKVDLYASWYEAKVSGNCRIKIDGYSGGVISKTGTPQTVYTCSGTKLINGAYISISNVNENHRISSFDADNNYRAIYSKIAYIIYNKSTNQTVLNPY